MSSSKYILHYGNVGGWPYQYAKSLRQAGIASQSVSPEKNDIDYVGADGRKLKRQLPTDSFLLDRRFPQLIRLLKKASFSFQSASNCSLVHYHGGPVFGQGLLDCRLFKSLHIPMIISWAGGDARLLGMARKNNPYLFRLPGISDEERDKEVRRRLETISKYVRFVATDPEMAEYSELYFNKVFILRQPIDLTEGKCMFPRRDTKKPVVVHIPTIPIFKGTAYIEATVERLKSEGLDFEFRQMESNLTQEQVRGRLLEADIYVDELLCGSYGLTPIESMSCGKPTITYIREDLVDKYPKELPLVNANPDTIYSKLKELILDAELRYEIGKKSRAYVEKYHSLDVIAPRLVEIYKEIGWKG
jgi:glycosyltransferase involved in cell wall biosynthesis